MKMLLFISLLMLISCGYKNNTSQTINSQQDTVRTENSSTALYSDTNFVSVFLDYEFSGEIQIFDKPNGKVIRKVKNDFDAEDNVMFGMLDKNDSMFYVVAYWALDGREIIKGWIYKNNHLGIFTRNYTIDTPLILYSTPNSYKNIIVIDKEYNPNMYEVVDFEERWLKIKANIKGKMYQGWIPHDMQCWNVYSTCN